MRLVRLITWAGRTLKIPGFTVDASPFASSRLVGRIRDLAPAAVVIDLDRLPAHGRAVAMVLRSSKSTCAIPIVFAGGLPEKVERARRDLPDAIFTDWKNAGRALKLALKRTPSAKPASYMQQWAGSSLSQKLGLKGEVAVIHAPEGFEELLGELSEDVHLRPTITRQTRLAIWFVRTRDELQDGIDMMTARLPQGCSMWIVFPKQSGRHRSDVTQHHVRGAALSVGLVDYKICAVDADWSGMKFARRKTGR